MSRKGEVAEEEVHKGIWKRRIQIWDDDNGDISHKGQEIEQKDNYKEHSL